MLQKKGKKEKEKKDISSAFYFFFITAISLELLLWVQTNLKPLLKSTDGKQGQIGKFIGIAHKVHIHQLFELHRFAHHALDHAWKKLRLIGSVRHLLNNHSHDFELVALFTDFQHLLAIGRRPCSEKEGRGGIFLKKRQTRERRGFDGRDLFVDIEKEGSEEMVKFFLFVIKKPLSIPGFIKTFSNIFYASE